MAQPYGRPIILHNTGDEHTTLSKHSVGLVRKKHAAACNMLVLAKVFILYILIIIFLNFIINTYMLLQVLLVVSFHIIIC